MSKAINLGAELVAGIDALPETGVRWLRAHGVSGSALLAWPGPVGMTRIETLDFGFWEPCDNGRPAFVQPALVGGAFSEILDLIAWFPSDPSACFQRTGHGPLLGWAWLDAARFNCLPVTLRASPLDWLRHGGSGVAVCNWFVAGSLLRGAVRLDCADEAHGREVRRRMSRTARVPEITIPKKEKAA